MKTDVAGRVKNTSLAASRPLLPLYESVVNSVQAIQDAEEQNGRIQIHILRDSGLFRNEQPELSEITGFDVIDNGVGFNEENYSAFETSDTTYKAQRGGRGIGRFLWLVAFDQVKVITHFREQGRIRSRHFEFVPVGDGVSNMTIADSSESSPWTKIRLVGFKTKYQEQCPKKMDTIGAHLVEHCLEYFIRNDCPEITLQDMSTDEAVNLNEQFEREMAGQSKLDKVTVEGHNFDMLHVRLYSSHVNEHQIHFCADSRVVKSEKLVGRIADLTRRLYDENGREFVYAVYIDSKVLDAAVTAERSDFSIPEDDAELLTKTLTWGTIRSAVIEKCREFLKPYTEPIREQKKVRIENFVSTEGPMYRPILKHIESEIDMIDPEITNEALDLKLYQAYHGLQVQLKTQGENLLQQDIKDDEWDEFLRQFQEYFDKVTDVNKSDLARYVCNRRAILDFLYKQLSLGNDGKYRREERVHQIIFPLRKTSEDVFCDEHNLWLLDEKLVYHSFLASDRPLRANPLLETKSRKEPDLIVFDKACAFAAGSDAPYSTITIIEFKRPMRDDYDAADNPFVQVRQYIQDIQEGKARTPNGRDIPVGNTIPFFCYVVSDITPNLEQWAFDFELTKTPDSQGFFGYKRQYNAYFEVISYTKMITDAKKRNVAFFDKLGLPTQINR